jgi:hypothetical protein
MGEITTLTKATTGKESLRTTVPMSILKHFMLEAGDKLNWDFEARNNEILIIVHPLKNFKEKGSIPIEKIKKTCDIEHDSNKEFQI